VSSALGERQVEDGIHALAQERFGIERYWHRRLVADLPRVFERVQQHFRAVAEITGAQLYAFAQRAAHEAGWTFSGAIAGHVVGEFSHNRWPGDKELMWISAHNPASMQAPDHLGRERHWILEIHLVDRAGGLRRVLRAAAVR
jgi:hypothetical protein